MLKFIYSTMNAGKTTDLISKYHQFLQKRLSPLVAKPNIDNREGDFNGWGFTKSRLIDKSIPAFYFDSIDEVIKKITFGVLLLDEVQFMLPEEVMKLTDLKQDVYAYGLKTDIKGNLFPASAKLLAISDSIEEIPMLCEKDGCKNKAVLHNRYVNGKLDRDGASIMVENGYITYKSVCLDCWKKER